MAQNMPFNPYPDAIFLDNESFFPPQFAKDFENMDPTFLDNVDPMLREGQQAPIFLSMQPQVGRQNSQQIQQPLQRYITEPQRALFTAQPLSNPQGPFFGEIHRASAPTSFLPYSQPRMDSPAPSQGFTGSSSAMSPAAEPDFSQEQFYSPQMRAQDDPAFANTLMFNQAYPGSWCGQTQNNPFTEAQIYSGVVQLSQIQSFSDLPSEEPTYEGDEGYAQYAMNADCQHGHHTMKTDHTGGSFHYHTDEGLGASIKDEGSPQDSSTIKVDDGTPEAEIDAEGEADNEIVVEDGASDTDYTPSRRTRKRRTSKLASPPAKRGRVSKNTSVSKAKSQSQSGSQPYSCKHCGHAPFKDSASLQRHVATSHTRAFTCVLAFAGCKSTFTSKNEWKRHTSTQHLNLQVYICSLGPCGNADSKPIQTTTGTVRGKEFNRKDLFTQHLRRMHAPFEVKRKQKKNQDWEDRVKSLQASCKQDRRDAPTKLMCPVQDCGQIFDGKNCWDDRMEHVGKHLEKAAAKGDRPVEQERDDLLVAWAVKEGIVVKQMNGSYKLVGSGQSQARVDDEDAECEDDDDDGTA